MAKALQRRLRQEHFESPVQESVLNVIVAHGFLDDRMDDVCSAFNISQQQYNILRILRGVYPEGYPCGEIRVRMLNRAPDITRRLDALVGHGYAQRDRRAEDRRVVLTRITESGLELLQRMDEPIRQIHETLSDRMSNREFIELSRLLEKLYATDD